MGFARDVDEMQEEVKKIVTFDDLHEIYQSCNKCKDTTIKSDAWMKYVNSPFMIIGANPSCKKDSRFDNKINKFYFRDNKYETMLNELFSEVNLTTKEIYITNLCKCATKENAELDLNMIKACSKKFLKDEMRIINPKIVFLFGKQVCETFNLKIGDTKEINDKLLIGLPHPASFKYGENKKRFSDILIKNKNIIKETKIDWGFCHLHVHNHHSLRDSVIKIPDLALFLKSNHKSHIVSTNHYTLSDCLQLQAEASKNGLMPVFGLEIAMMDDIQEFYDALNSDDSKLKKELKEKKSRHLTLIAKNEEGFSNLIKIHNNGWLKGYYRRPYVDYKFVLEHSKGLICLSACSSGILSYELLHNKKNNAIKYAKELKKTFGKDFYIELIMINFEDQLKITDELINISEKLKIKTVITGDIHYLKKEDNIIREMMYNLYNKNITIDKMKENADTGCNDLYYKSYFDLKKLFNNKYKSKIFTSKVLMKSIEEVSCILGKVENYEIPRADNSKSFFEDKLAMIKEKLTKNFKDKIKQGLIDKDAVGKYKERLNKELSVISEMNYIDYFLILEDIISYCKKKHGKYSVGPGRGSAAGSLVSYVLGITDVDPIRFELLFERFLSRGREDMVDIDVDFAADIRDDVVKYIAKRFGENHVVSIGTASLLKTKTVILDVSRFLGIQAQEVFKITTGAMKGIIDEELTLEELCNTYPALSDYVDNNPLLKTYFHKLKKNIRHYSKHAAGILITVEDLHETLPIIKVKGEIVSAWQEGADYHELSRLDYCKFDILGLNGLKIINDTVKLVGKKINFDKIDLDDVVINEFMKRDDYAGIFQFESTLAQNVIRRVRPKGFEDYVHINSLLRPGPLRAGMVDEYAARKNNEKPYTIHESLKDILGKSYGVVIEQEQIMKIAQKIGDFTEVESNKFRKALVKYSKSAENERNRLGEVMSYKDKFIKNASKKLGSERANKLFSLISHFAAYGFNRSHSLAYAMVAYREMFLKTYHTAEFYTSLLNNVDAAKKDKHMDFVLKKYIISLLNHKIEILPPDINKSGRLFQLDENKIRFGLSNIKFVSDAAINQIEGAKPIKSIDDMQTKGSKRILNKRVVESLIFSRSFDGLYKDTKSALASFKKSRKEKYDDETDFIQKEASVMRICLTELLQLKELRRKYRLEGDVGKVSGKMLLTSQKNTKYFRFSFYNDIKHLDSIYVWSGKTFNKFKDVQNGDILSVITIKKSKFLYLKDFRIIKGGKHEG